MNKKTKHTIQLYFGFSLALFGCLLIIASFIVPPMGVLHSSVLAAVGEIFTFSGCLLGIDYKFKYKMYEYQKNKDESNE